ncbi:MAG: SMP-30/gluconolactonase/LRE family protein [Burkholderiaceae bacterium]
MPSTALRDVEPTRTGPHRGARGREPRPGRQFVRGVPARRHQPFRAGLRAHEVFAHIGGQPRHGVRQGRQPVRLCRRHGAVPRLATGHCSVEKATDETNQPALHQRRQPSAPDDLDIAPDGRVFFSEATTRYEMHEWPVDSLRHAATAASSRYDPVPTRRTVLRNLLFPNGIAIASDGQSFLLRDLGCTVKRYFRFDGPRSGQTETVIANLPGYPDNINRASDGNYWLALVGMRTPSFDLALRTPLFRKRIQHVSG